MKNFEAEKHYDKELFTIYFSKVSDPRRQKRGNFRHELMDMIFLVIAAVVSGADDCEEIALFGRAQIDWLRKYAPFKYGTPSHDTLGRVFSAIDFQ